MVSGALTLDAVDVAIEEPPDDLVALDDALAKLAQTIPTSRPLVKLRYFAGLTIDEAAEVLGISSSTADRHWTYARAWLVPPSGQRRRAVRLSLISSGF